MDYRNDINNLDRNTILYAHGRLNGTMFGSLKIYLIVIGLMMLITMLLNYLL